MTENDEESVVVADEGPGTTGTSAVKEGIRETHNCFRFMMISAVIVHNLEIGEIKYVHGFHIIHTL